jgi:hypothetical protein
VPGDDEAASLAVDAYVLIETCPEEGAVREARLEGWDLFEWVLRSLNVSHTLAAFQPAISLLRCAPLDPGILMATSFARQDLSSSRSWA